MTNDVSVDETHAETPATPAAPAPPRRRRGRSLALLIALIGVAAVVLSVAGLFTEMTRKPTTAERHHAVSREIAQRWRSWPAGKLFPATVPYTGGTAGRVGIGTDAQCGTAVDPAFAVVLARTGCVAAPRATYVDETRGLAVTVGVLAFPDTRSAGAARAQINIGLRAVAFPGTSTERFNDAGRQAYGARQAGPYLVLTTIGYADGRPVEAGKKPPGLFETGGQIGDAIAAPLTVPAVPKCGAKGWKC